MAENTLQIPIEYIINTTSDWTIFEIVEGGWWRDIFVTLLEGSEPQALSQDIFYNRKKIWIRKNRMDRSRIMVRVSCILNIPIEYLHSDILYRITKGSIEATVVDIFANGKALFSSLVNATQSPNDPNNPLTFTTRVQDPIPEKKKTGTIEVMEKKDAKQEKELEPKQENFIFKTFDAKFKETFQKKKATENDVKEVFEWIGTQGENATKLLEADICRTLVLDAEIRFRGNKDLQKKINEESKKAGKKITKRYDELRKIEGKISIKAQQFGFGKEEKKIAPKK
jgi:hypothetical protein